MEKIAYLVVLQYLQILCEIKNNNSKNAIKKLSFATELLNKILKIYKEIS